MGKRLSFPTRSLGSDTLLPDQLMLARWVSERRGRQADLTSFQIEQGVIFQIEAGITSLCAGGMQYKDRWREAFTGLTGQTVTGELGADSADIIRDAEDLARIRSGLWISVPAPSQLAFENRYYGDQEEADHALFKVYKTLMREQRDAGIGGHVFLCDTLQRAELEVLAMKKTFFYCPSLNRRSLGMLLEYQQTVAVEPKHLSLVSDLMGEYEVHRIVLLDPAEQDLRMALQMRDADQIVCGGYCHVSCETYWKNLAGNASILK